VNRIAKSVCVLNLRIWGRVSKWDTTKPY